MSDIDQSAYISLCILFAAVSLFLSVVFFKTFQRFPVPSYELCLGSMVNIGIGVHLITYEVNNENIYEKLGYYQTLFGIEQASIYYASDHKKHRMIIFYQLMVASLQYSSICGLKYIDSYAYAFFISALFGIIRVHHICKISKDHDNFEKRILEVLNSS